MEIYVSLDYQWDLLNGILFWATLSLAASTNVSSFPLICSIECPRIIGIDVTEWDIAKLLIPFTWEGCKKFLVFTALFPAAKQVNFGFYASLNSNTTIKL